jgi:hypothetical protein
MSATDQLTSGSTGYDVGPLAVPSPPGETTSGQCIAFLRSDPHTRCCRHATDTASGCCGVHSRQTSRHLFQAHEDDCAICLNTMKYKTRIPASTMDVIPLKETTAQGRGIIQTDCTHIFHTRCLKRWMICHNNLTCPMCRASIMTDLKVFDDIPYYKKLAILYCHFPPPNLGYMFPSHLSSMLMMPSVIRALGLSEEHRAILIDIAFNCVFSGIFFRVLRQNKDILGG